MAIARGGWGTERGVSMEGRSQEWLKAGNHFEWVPTERLRHAGKLNMESGGPVTIELRTGESAYKGSLRNGIKTNDYGAYGRSFVVK